jgi:hypothetical protein
MVVSGRGPRALFAAAFVALAVPAFAQPAQDAASAQALRSEIDQLKQDFDARLAALESRLAALEGGQSAKAAAEPATQAEAAAVPAGSPPPAAQAPAGVDGSGGAGGALPVYGDPAGSSKVFNPDMAAIGNFVGAAGKNNVNPLPALALPEAEVSLQAVVDPYARADFFFSFGEEGVAIEEGYLTFPTLPGGLLMKVGRQYEAFGKANTLHSHVLPWVDRPLVTSNLLGGEEPLADAGISVARLIPNPWLFLEATGQVMRGDGGDDVFHSSTRSDLSYVGHVRGYHDLSESTNLDIGTSYAYGHNASGVVDGVDVGRFTTSLFGVDATLRWRPLQRSIYHSFLGRAEMIWSRRDQPTGRQDASGFYVSGDYQFARRWFTGVRFDYSERAADASAHDTGPSLVLTYRPSEFSQVRGQYRRTNYAEGETANEFLFQFQFAIGAHGAHPF